MPIELAGIKLTRVHKVVTLEQAAFVYHHVPGLQGNVAQDLGRNSVRLQIEGIFYGPKAAEDMEALRKIYKKRAPVDFLAEVVGQAYFGQVTLDCFEVFQLAADPDQFSYSLTVVEYVKPPKPATAAPDSAVNAAIQAEAQNFMDMATLPDALQMGSIPEVTNPVAPLTGALDQITAASGNLQAVTGGLSALFTTRIDTTEVTTPEDWGKPPPLPPLDWGSPPEAPPGPEGPMLGPNGELLGPDGQPLLGPSGEMIGPDGKPLLGPNGELLGPGGETLLGPDGKPLGPDGKPLEIADKTAWLALGLTDEEGQPVAGVRYVITLADETTREGTLDEQGQAQLEKLEAGTYTLTFPDLDAADWGPAEVIGAGGEAETPTAPSKVEAGTARLVFELVDEDGQPVAGTRYVITLADGTVREGMLDEQGRTHLEGLEVGTYRLAFPDLDAADWGLAEAVDTEVGEEAETPIESETTAGTAWLAFELLDEDGQAVAGEVYRVILPDGTIQEGTLDTQGQARLEGITAGTWSISFPNLDANDW